MKHARWNITTVGVVVSFVLLHALTPALAVSRTGPPPVVEEITIEAVDIDFNPNAVAIPADTDVAVTLINSGSIEHTFTIDELDIDVVLAPGEETEITINAEAGEYTYYCTVPGHREAGQVGTMVVEVGANDAATIVPDPHAEESTDVSEEAPPSRVGMSVLQLEVAALQTVVAELEVRVDALEARIAAEERGTDQVAPTAATTPGVEPTLAPISDGTVEVGQAFAVGTWEVTVTDVEFVPELATSYATKTARGVYVVVSLLVVNTSTTSQEFPYRDLKLSNDAGRTYDVANDVMALLLRPTFELSIYEDLQPDLPYETGVVFDVPPDSTGLVLTTLADSFRVALGDVDV